MNATLKKTNTRKFHIFNGFKQNFYKLNKDIMYLGLCIDPGLDRTWTGWIGEPESRQTTRHYFTEF